MSDILDQYRERLQVNGESRREIALHHAQDYTQRKITSSLSFHTVKIDCVEQKVSIIDTEEFNEKKIVALPGEKLKHGGIVQWHNNHWLITEVDAENEVNERGLIKQCNHILRWRDESGEIIEKWVVVEDGTKYLIGEKSEEKMATGDARIAVTMPKDSDTIKLGRGRRFLIADDDAESVLAYAITKPNTLYNVYNGSGVFRHILTEVNLTEYDDIPLRVADYYQPAMNTKADSFQEVVDNDDNKKGWL